MQLIELSIKYNLPFNIIIDFFKKNNIEVDLDSEFGIEQVAIIEENISELRKVIDNSLRTNYIGNSKTLGRIVLPKKDNNANDIEPKLRRNYKLERDLRLNNSQQNPRLLAVAKEFNVGRDTIIDYLQSIGFMDELKDTTKLSNEMYKSIQSEFRSDNALKNKADQVEIPKSNLVTNIINNQKEFQNRNNNERIEKTDVVNEIKKTKSETIKFKNMNANEILHFEVMRKVILVISLSVSSLSTFSQDVKTIELRNYLIRPGQRDNYITTFETKLVDTLNLMRNYVFGQFRVKDAQDNFVWIRGFESMDSRKEDLKRFFTSEFWKRNQSAPGKYLLNYMNVYLLRPIDIYDQDNLKTFKGEWFGKSKGVVVVDFYVANERRPQLIAFVKSKYDSIVRAAGVNNISYWVSEPEPNNYPDLPVFQDKNLLVSISIFKDEKTYRSISENVVKSMGTELMYEMLRIVTTKTTWVLYPTDKSFTSK